MTADLLIVEDEIKLAELLNDYLTHAGYHCQLCHDGKQALALLRAHDYRLVLLDLMLPGLDGISICTETRRTSNVPIIMLTAKVDEVDRLLGLETGADDYICKPFSPREVVARVKALLRRSERQTNPPEAGLHLDEDRLEVSLADQPALTLTLVEFQLLKALASQPGRIWSRQKLMELIYPDHRIVADRTIDSHIKKLRRKLSDHFQSGDWIGTVYGAGYRLQLDE